MSSCYRCTLTSNLLSYLINGQEQDVCEGCMGSMPSDTPRLFKVPSYNLSVLRTKFDKLARRANKCGLPQPTFQEIRTQRKVDVVTDPQSGEKSERVTLLHYITVDPGCTVIKVNGWTFIATIQHTEEGNILRKVGENHIPSKYRNVSQLCEHCNTARNRKDTYILRNELTGDYKQVGRSCLADFFGHDALMYAERAQYMCDISSLSESMEDDMGFGGSSGPKYDMLERYLSHVAQCIMLDGWMSRSRARSLGDYGGAMATADIAMSHLHPAPRFVPMYRTPSDEAVKVAEESIEWASNLEGEELSDYLHNIRTIAKRGVCEGRDAGLAASIVSSYQRHINTLRQKELQARRAEVSQYVGVVGERRAFKLNVEKVLPFERDGYGYGASSTTVHLHLMSDNDGNVFNWWSSKGALETNADVVLFGTVKSHSEYKGVKQTTLTRCDEVTYKNYIVVVEGTKYTFEALCEDDVKKELRLKLNVKRLPKGIAIVVDSAEKVTGVGDEATFTIAV